MSMNLKKLDNAFKKVDEAVKEGCFPCAAVSVGHKDGIYRTEYYGNRCIYPSILPLNRDTLFDLASLTKVIATNTLFMVFLEKGIISVYDKISDFVDCFSGGKKDEITIFNLLTHTAGFVPCEPLYSLCSDYNDAVRYICGSDLQYEPGTKTVYSDFSFILLGYILEEVGHGRLDKLCKKYVFEPLEMINTCYNPNGLNIAATEVDSETGKALIGTVHDKNARFFGGVSGHAGLFSNIDDMNNFASMLINNGIFKEKRFLSLSTIKEMTRNYTKNLEEDRGLGWCIKGERTSSGGDIISPTAFGHTGFTGTSVWIDTDKDVFIILLTNRVHPSRENNKIIRFRRLFHNMVISSIE